MQAPEVTRLASSSAIAETAAARVARAVHRAVERRGRARIALSGGKTPRDAYRLLATPPFLDDLPWQQVDVFWGDERCVPPDHAESNYRMALEALLVHVTIPKRNIHRMRGEIAPAAAAREYELTLRTVCDCPARETPRLDVVLLGLGVDGHTASLFPGSPALTASERLALATYVHKLHGWRITLTPRVLNAARAVLFLVAGAEKAGTVRDVLQGPVDPDRLPAQIVRPTDGRVEWLLDGDAAGLLASGTAPARSD